MDGAFRGHVAAGKCPGAALGYPAGCACWRHVDLERRAEVLRLVGTRVHPATRNGPGRNPAPLARTVGKRRWTLSDRVHALRGTARRLAGK